MVPGPGLFPARYAGITHQDAMYDSRKLFSAYKKTITELEPNMYFNPCHCIRTSGDALEAVDCKQIKWPAMGSARTGRSSSWKTSI